MKPPCCDPRYLSHHQAAFFQRCKEEFYPGALRDNNTQSDCVGGHVEADKSAEMWIVGFEEDRKKGLVTTLLEPKC